MPLVPEAGGTERITSLIATGLSERGYTCLDILVFDQNTGTMTYKGQIIDDLYAFLKKNRVDIVINQIAYATWLLESFLTQGGSRWHSKGGKIISCLHFDPCNPSFIQLLRSCEHLSVQQHILLLKHQVFKSYYRKKQQVAEGSIYNYIYDNSDRVVVLSASHFEYLKMVMRRSEYSKLSSIGNPLTFHDIADQSVIDGKTKTAFVCARMSEYHKRITIILKAWKMIKKYSMAADWHLIIVGDGPDLARYKRITAEQNIVDVKFLGQQSPDSYYKSASILLLASSAEGWGLTITEGLQNGVVPVVMNSSSVYNDIIQQDYNGILSPNNNVKAFSKAIKSLMEDSDRLKAMQLNALSSANQFTLEKVMEKWINLLSSL